MSGLKSPAFIIENMVLTARLAGPIDLDEIAASFYEASFEPDRIMRVSFRLMEPRVTLLIFASGKMVCLGAKSAAEGARAFRVFVETVRSAHNLEDTQLKGRPRIRNITATVDMGLELDLNRLNALFEGSVYMPEVTPSLTVRMNGSATALLFGNGKVVFTGVDSMEKMQDCVNELWEKVRAFSEGANIALDEQI